MMATDYQEVLILVIVAQMMVMDYQEALMEALMVMLVIDLLVEILQEVMPQLAREILIMVIGKTKRIQERNNQQRKKRLILLIKM